MGGGVALTPTSCSKDDKETQDFSTITINVGEGEVWPIYPTSDPTTVDVGKTNLFDASAFTAEIDGDDTAYTIDKISGKSGNSSILAIEDVTSSSFVANPKAIGETTLKITVEDTAKGKKGTATINVKIKKSGS